MEAGLLDETREERGWRRRLLTITPAGADALVHWRQDPTVVPVEARDLALLKLFLGDDLPDGGARRFVEGALACGSASTTDSS